MGSGINGTTITNIDRAVLLNGKYKFDERCQVPSGGASVQDEVT